MGSKSFIEKVAEAIGEMKKEYPDTEYCTYSSSMGKSFFFSLCIYFSQIFLVSIASAISTLKEGCQILLLESMFSQ